MLSGELTKEEIENYIRCGGCCRSGAGTISYKNANTSSSPDVQEVEEAEKLNPVGPAFNADSALAYCAAQCDFGPRVMNSEAHDKCGEWIVSKFKQFGCEVETQKADLKGYDARY